MKITIQNTSQVVEANGVKCRVWEGETDSGIKVQCLIPRIAALATDDLSQFEAELQEMRAPSSAMDVFPLRMIL